MADVNNQSKEEGRKMVFDVKDKEAWDFLYACSAGHQGSIVSISGNYEGVLVMTTKTFKCNAHADIRDYQQLRVDEKTINAILQNCNVKILFKESEKSVAVNPGPNAE